jgi:protoheme IX farnesyltransferase
MWWERDVDGKMSRTKNRPLPAGRLSPDVALLFGLLLAIVSAPLLFAVNGATGLLGLTALVTYVLLYTPLKRVSHLALLVGAVPGAIPPLMGWSSVTGSIGAGGLALFAVLFFWQIPHFGAIALFRADDYARAGLQVVSVQKGERATRRMIAVYTVLLVASTFLFQPLNLAGGVYGAVAFVLGTGFLALAFHGLRGPSAGIRWARQLFGGSIVYLVILLAALLFDRVQV